MIDLGIPNGVFNGQPWYETPTRDKGYHCGECGRFLKAYHRRLSCSMARGLVRLYVLGMRYPDRKAFHVKLFDKEGARGEFGVLAAWGLVVELPNESTEQRRSGMWSLTEFGRHFIELRESVPQFVILKWGSELLGFSGPMVNVKECLEHGNRFRYDELMAWKPEDAV